MKDRPSPYTLLFTIPRPAVREWAAGMAVEMLEHRAEQIEGTIDAVRLRIKGQESNPLNNEDALLLDKMEDVLAILEVEMVIRNLMEGK